MFNIVVHIRSDASNTRVDRWIWMKGHKVFWLRIIQILKDQNCFLFAEEDLCDGEFFGPYEDVDFVAHGEELLRWETILLGWLCDQLAKGLRRDQPSA